MVAEFGFTICGPRMCFCIFSDGDAVLEICMLPDTISFGKLNSISCRNLNWGYVILFFLLNRPRKLKISSNRIWTCHRISAWSVPNHLSSAPDLCLTLKETWFGTLGPLIGLVHCSMLLAPWQLGAVRHKCAANGCFRKVIFPNISQQEASARNTNVTDCILFTL